MVSKYTFNHNFFKTIDSEAKAYFLGLMFADGNISLNHTTKTIRLVSKDRCLLQKFISSINGNNRIYEETHNKFKTKCYKVRISSSQMYDNLNSIGCVPRKSLVLKFPHILPPLTHHFIRGYFDGDGTVGNYNVARTTWKRLSSGFCGTKDMLEGIMRETSLIVIPISRTNLTTISYSVENSLKLYKYMYNNATIFLDRKKVIFDSYIQGRSTTTIGHPRNFRVKV